MIDPIAVQGDRWVRGNLIDDLDPATGRRPWPGVALYYAVLGYNLAVTAWLAEWTMLAIGVALHGTVAPGSWRARQRSGAVPGLESQRA